MYPIHSIIVSTALSALLLAGNASAASKAQVDDATAKLAAAASPMKAVALEKLYVDRTWKWKDGGGFFSADGKQFTAWSRKRAAWSYAEGRWYAINGGKLCLRARWSSKMDWSSKMERDGAVTCFLHREKDGVIYQKPSLGGKWYVFRHNPVREGDESLKLVKGDRVSKEVSRLKDIRR
ncbi:DUF995 domain-containing protein (plasmid) [Rhizobium sullae]|uniref:DUF995 domain-containing protein n=1 Tax=Rhizobium sullae TaxID=50338 RepID=A0A2N0DGV8_RHISU|nr:DUF995 domain-containing protein [Rhizobium sullae]PKA45355.1 DUF995 domain-containing protein [Rhizobium sullae]UWU18621.1 DUF995 domain-containing protein [Rhizobium sullae]